MCSGIYVVTHINEFVQKCNRKYIAIQKIKDVVTVIYGCILCSGEGKHENTVD